MKSHTSRIASLGFLLFSIAFLISLWLWIPEQAPRPSDPTPADFTTKVLAQTSATQSKETMHDFAVKDQATRETVIGTGGVYVYTEQSAGAHIPGIEIRLYAYPKSDIPIRVAFSDALKPTFFGDVPTGRYLVCSPLSERVYLQHISEKQSTVRLLIKGKPVRGTVIDDLGAPFEGALLTIDQMDGRGLGAVGISGKDGQFKLQAVPFGARLIALASGKQPSAPVAAPPDSEEAVVLRLGGEAGALRIRAVDANTGQGLEAWCVCHASLPSATHPGARSPLERRIDAADGFRLDCLPHGPVHLTIEADGFAPLSMHGEVPATGEQVMVARLTRGAIIHVRVEQSSGAPQSGARISTGDYTRLAHEFTDHDGRAVLRGVAAGKCVVTAMNNGRIGQTTVLAEEGQEAHCQITLPGSTTIKGRCVNERNQPLPNMRLELQSLADRRADAARMTTDEDGRFEFRHALDGLHQIEVYPSTYSSFPIHNARVNPKDGFLLLVVAESKTNLGGVAGVVDDLDCANMSVTVREAPGGTPTLGNSRQGKGVSCDKDGKFEMNPIPSGDYAFEVRLPDATLFHTGTFTVLPGEITNLGVLRRAGLGSLIVTIDGDLSEEEYSGLSLKSASLSFSLKKSGNQFSTDTVPEGKYWLTSFGALPPLYREVSIISGAESSENVSARNARSHNIRIASPGTQQDRRYRLAIQSARGELLRALEFNTGQNPARTSLTLDPEFYQILVETLDGYRGSTVIDGGGDVRTHHIDLY